MESSKNVYGYKEIYGLAKKAHAQVIADANQELINKSAIFTRFLSDNVDNVLKQYILGLYAQQQSNQTDEEKSIILAVHAKDWIKENDPYYQNLNSEIFIVVQDDKIHHAFLVLNRNSKDQANGWKNAVIYDPWVDSIFSGQNYIANYSKNNIIGPFLAEKIIPNGPSHQPAQPLYSGNKVNNIFQLNPSDVKLQLAILNLKAKLIEQTLNFYLNNLKTERDRLSKKYGINDPKFNIINNKIKEVNSYISNKLNQSSVVFSNSSPQQNPLTEWSKVLLQSEQVTAYNISDLKIMSESRFMGVKSDAGKLLEEFSSQAKNEIDKILNANTLADLENYENQRKSENIKKKI